MMKIITKKIFFYLDAHSEDDYPLIDELSFIIKNIENFVILIDDFQVQMMMVMVMILFKEKAKYKIHKRSSYK